MENKVLEGSEPKFPYPAPYMGLGSMCEAGLRFERIREQRRKAYLKRKNKSLNGQ